MLFEAKRSKCFFYFSMAIKMIIKKMKKTEWWYLKNCIFYNYKLQYKMRVLRIKINRKAKFRILADSETEIIGSR